MRQNLRWESRHHSVRQLLLNHLASMLLHGHLFWVSWPKRDSKKRPPLVASMPIDICNQRINQALIIIQDYKEQFWTRKEARSAVLVSVLRYARIRVLPSVLETATKEMFWTFCHLLPYMYRGAGMTQWWEHSPLTMWPGFDSRTRRHMWVEFVVGSRPCSERFFSGYSGFPLSSKSNTSEFQFDLESAPN